VMARIYREMPLNSIWEGAGNVMALDLLRALRGSRHGAPAADALAAELAGVRGSHRVLDSYAAALRSRIGAADDEAGARRLAQDVALVLQAALLTRHAPEAVADAFCRTRLAGAAGHVFGTLPAGIDATAIVARARPR
jgi:putative acyl-CoA dehydrogenase